MEAALRVVRPQVLRARVPVVLGPRTAAATMNEGVLTYPTYLLKFIPLEIRDRISEEAAERDIAVQDVVRSALCENYGIPFERGQVHAYMPQKDKRSTTLLLRLEPKIFRAVGRQAQREECSIREIILDILEERYGMKEGG